MFDDDNDDDDVAEDKDVCNLRPDRSKGTICSWQEKVRACWTALSSAALTPEQTTPVSFEANRHEEKEQELLWTTCRCDNEGIQLFTTTGRRRQTTNRCIMAEYGLHTVSTYSIGRIHE
jgi:hypothetical protein